MPLFQVRQYKQAVRLQGHQDRLDRDHGADQLTGPGQREGWQVPCVHQYEQESASCIDHDLHFQVREKETYISQIVEERNEFKRTLDQ